MPYTSSVQHGQDSEDINIQSN